MIIKAFINVPIYYLFARNFNFGKWNIVQCSKFYTKNIFFRNKILNNVRIYLKCLWKTFNLRYIPYRPSVLTSERTYWNVFTECARLICFRYYPAIRIRLRWSCIICCRPCTLRKYGYCRTAFTDAPFAWGQRSEDVRPTVSNSR